MVMKLSSCACLLPLACSLLPSALAEGFNGSLDFEQRINGKTVLKTIEPIRERLQDLSAVFFSGHDVVIYGIVLSPDGYIATKASELHYHQNLVVRIGSSKYGHFKEIGTDPATDIAVVKVDAASLPAPGPVSNEAAMGMMVVSNGSTTRTSRRPQLGTLSAARRPIPNGDTAYMGVIFGTPCSIQEVVKDGPAAKAGAMAGDEILEVDGTPITTLEAVSPHPVQEGDRGKSDAEGQAQGQKAFLRHHAGLPAAGPGGRRSRGFQRPDQRGLQQTQG